MSWLNMQSLTVKKTFIKINPELFLDTLMMELRRGTILFLGREKRERISMEQLLNHDIEISANNLIQNNVMNEDILAELDNKRVSLENIYNYQAQGAYIRSRAAYKVGRKTNPNVLQSRKIQWYTKVCTPTCCDG